MRVDLGEFRTAYLAEVEEHLSGVRARLADVERGLESGHVSPRATRDLMRLLHTVKGLSAMVGVEAVVTIAHHMETLVRAAEASPSAWGAPAVAALFEGLGAIDARVRAVAAGGTIAVPPRALLGRLAGLASEVAPFEKAPPRHEPEWFEGLDAAEREQLQEARSKGANIVRVRFAPSAARAEAGFNITTLRAELTSRGEIIKVVPLAEPASPRTPTGLAFSLLVATEAKDDTLVAPGFEVEIERLAFDEDAADDDDDDSSLSVLPDTDPGAAASLASLRVDLERVEDALERFSALVVNRAKMNVVLRNMRAAGVDVRELAAVFQENAVQMRELRGSILRLRMVPVEAVLGGLPLMIRGLARATEKEVELSIDNGAAELDKTVAEKLVPALLHLIRNAVDHGIERPDERVAAGKPRKARVRVSCTTLGGRSVELRVSDDGRGVDRAALAARAGLDGDVDDETLLAVMCRAGISTRAAADTISGRGMGMDIVRKVVVEELHGELSLETRAGAGTTFTLRVPLSIAIVDGFTVMCSGQLFLVPVPFVEEIVELPPDTTRERTGPRLLARRGESVPVWDLAHAVGLELGTTDRASDRKHALIVRKNRAEVVAFAVDRVVHQQEAVVRPLDDVMVSVPGIAGATDLGDGMPTIVVDLFGLCTKLAEAVQ